MDNPAWIEICADIKKELTDSVTAKLSAMGFDSISILDGQEFFEELEACRAAWDYVDEKLAAEMEGVCRITFYLPESRCAEIPDIRSRLESIREGSESAVKSITLRTLRENDWAESWKQYYRPVPIGERLLIQPEWEPTAPTNRAVFLNDPGLSFGTGEHETTRLCLRALEKLVFDGCSVLDAGCGSGILSVCARLLGASRATAVDIDPQAAAVARKNALRNKIDSEYRVFSGDILSDTALLEEICDRKYDIVCANIVADVIIALCPLVPRLLSDGGVFIASGIIEARLGDVISAIERSGLSVSASEEENGWCLISAELK